MVLYDIKNMTKKISEYYDLLSGIYDEKTGEFGWIPCIKAVEVINRNKIIDLGNILELGCGTGQFLDETKKTEIKKKSYLGVDISPKMVEIIKQKYLDIIAKEMDIEENINTIEGKFDTVVMIGVFEFLNKKEYVLDEIYKKLNQGGYLLFSFEELIDGHPLQSEKISPMGKNGDIPIHPLTDFDNFRYTLEEIKEILGDKFEIVDTESFVGYYKTVDRIPIYYTLVLARKK